MKIGVGVTTYNRPEHLKNFQCGYIENKLSEYVDPFEVGYYCANDGIVSFDKQQTLSRKGIAYRKNECLRALKDCDYIFLFDDDCFPIKEGWADFFIEASKSSGQQHFMYLKETPTIKTLWTCKGNGPYWITEYNNCAGCMMFMTKECIEKVGAYNPEYGIYGFEHAGYSNRIHKAGLTPLGAYTCPAGAGEYIYSLDLDNHLPFNKQLNHKPSIEVGKMGEYVEKNREVYLNDTEIYIPL